MSKQCSTQTLWEVKNKPRRERTEVVRRPENMQEVWGGGGWGRGVVLRVVDETLAKFIQMNCRNIFICHNSLFPF